MDPITAIVLTLFLLASSSAMLLAIKRNRSAHQHRALQTDLRAHHRLEDQRLSLFDVFWDLGASGFALELMAHHDLLPTSPDETYGAVERLKALVHEHGDYGLFLEDSLDAIQEFFSDHRYAGDRRRLPGLTGAQTRSIAVPRRLTTDQPSSTAYAPPTAAHLQERRDLRMGRQHPGLASQVQQDHVDIDHVGDFTPGAILRSLVDGNLSGQIDKWFKLRGLRQKRQELDRRLSDFYDFYAEIARQTQDFYTPLYDAHKRWQDEATRLRLERRRRRWSDRTFASAADVLYDDAIALAEQLSSRAYEATYLAIETLHDYARRGDKKMAGFLVYLNRHAFFAGRHPSYADHSRHVEFATQRVREEIITLRDEGIL